MKKSLALLSVAAIAATADSGGLTSLTGGAGKSDCDDATGGDTFGTSGDASAGSNVISAAGGDVTDNTDIGAININS